MVCSEKALSTNQEEDADAEMSEKGGVMRSIIHTSVVSREWKLSYLHKLARYTLYYILLYVVVHHS